MALVHVLTEAGYTPRGVETEARAHLRMVDGAPTIQRIELDTTVDAPGLAEPGLQELAATAKVTCAVSRAVQGLERIELATALVG